MSQAVFHFHGNLNDLLQNTQRGQDFPVLLAGQPSAKHLIEALGVPHVEVHQLLVNRRAAELGHLVQDGDYVEVYPAPPAQAARPEGAPCFALDGHLGRLAAYLRLLGFDTLYHNEVEDADLAEAAGNSRILLSRDRRLLMRKLVIYGYCLRSLEPSQQVKEVVRRYGLGAQATPFRRCLRCNTPLESVSKAEILHRLEPLTRRYYDEFHRCPGCAQLYWKGSHFQRMNRLAKIWINDEGD